MGRSTFRFGPAWLILILLLAASPAQARKKASAPAPKLAVVPVSADASARADAPNRRSGTRSTLRVDGAPLARAFLRFKPANLAGKVVRSASLWVHLDRPASVARLTAGGTNRRAWSERTLTWRVRPAAGPATGTGKLAVGKGWRKLDVTPLVRQNGTIDIALSSTSAAGVALTSREGSRKYAPRLHLLVTSESQPAFPIRAAFYSARYPAGWAAGTRYHPKAGHYDGASASVIADQLGGLAYGRMSAAIVPWAGPGTASDTRDARLLAATNFFGSPVKWAYQPSAELFGDPSPARIATLLAALDVAHGRDSAYLRVRGRPVVFIPAEAEDTCDAVSRWVKGNATSRFYLVFAEVPNSEECQDPPSDWYQATPSARLTTTGGSSVSISPGEFEAGTASAKLPRDLFDFAGAVRAMESSRTRFHLLTSYDGWTDGTTVEPAAEWASPSGYGQYLDVLHAAGTIPAIPAATVAAAGDVGCGVNDQASYGTTPTTCEAGATAGVVESLQPTAALVIGDDTHGQATLADFQQGYDPYWGAFKAITHPAPGNHEYCDSRCADPPGAFRAGYLAYWGAQAEPSGTPWYSFDLGSWHLISLDSECEYNGGCGPGSPEETWLRADLAAHPTACTLAYWHRPRFTGGHEGEAPSTGTLWNDLYQAGVELVLNGHQHMYERFLPQTPGRVADASGGVLEMVVGTGGRSHIGPVTVRGNTVVQNADTFGVLSLRLAPYEFSWGFVPAPGLGGTFTDAGSGHCH